MKKKLNSDCKNNKVIEIDDLIISYKGGTHNIKKIECHAELLDGSLVLIAYLWLGKAMDEEELNSHYEEIYNHYLEIARNQGYELVGYLEA